MRFFAFTFLVLLAPLPSMAEPLPRVLILGDSIYQQPSRQVATLLKDKAEIVRSDMKSGEIFNTTTALANLDELIGDGKWDLIHFNFGLGDLVHRATGMKSFRSMSKESGGIPATDPAQYEKNLSEIVKRLQASRAKLVWASTTPIRKDPHGIFEPGSEIEYNAIAAKIMAANRIPVSDMHAAVGTMLDASKLGSPDPFSFGKDIQIHTPIVSAICRQLSIPVPKETEK